MKNGDWKYEQMNIFSYFLTSNLKNEKKKKENWEMKKVGNENRTCIP